jgi:ribosome-associated translation inhibitor RaiA
MERSIHPQLALNQVNPEILSYIYQCLTELEPYATANTEMAVIARDPLELSRRGEESLPKDELRKMYRICISLREQGTKIEAEGLDHDIFTAIRSAKDKLLKDLREIHDSVVSASERNIQIQSVLGGHSIH